MSEANRFRFTIAELDAITPPPRGRRYYYDTLCPSLAFCVTSNNARTFYRCGRISGTFRRVRLGAADRITITQARKAASKVSNEAALGRDPLVGSHTLGDLHAWFMEHHSKPHKRTWERDESHFKKYLSRWKKRRLSSLRRGEVQALHTEITGTSTVAGLRKRGSGRGAANNMLVLLRTMLGRAVELGWIDVNVAAGVRRNKRNERERFLNAEELPKFFAAVAQLQRETTRDFLIVALFTGGRRQNVLEMRWDELDLDRAMWLIPGRKFKNKKPQAVALSPEAMEILRRRLAARDVNVPWVFPGQSKAGHFNEPKAAWKRIRDLSGLPDFVLHDLRRTLGSWQAGTGASLHIIGKSLGHKTASATQIYARLELEPVREAVNKATAAISAAVNDSKKPG